MQRFARRFVVALVPVLSLLGGCGEAPTPMAAPHASLALPAEASPRFSTTGGGGTADLRQVARYTVPPSDTVGFVKSWIGPKGGVVRFPGNFVIEVPAGAVDRVTMFEIHVSRSGPENGYVVGEFKPHQNFLRTVFVELPLKNTTAEGGAASVLWWNSASASWVNVGGTATRDGQRVRTEVKHFSTYATTGNGASAGSTTLTAGG